MSLLVCVASPVWSTPAQDELQREEQAAALSIVGKSKALAGDYQTCAALYHQAARTDPSLAAYLYSAALCETKARNWGQAEKTWGAFLSRAAQDDALRLKAQRRLREVREALARTRERERKAAAQARRAQAERLQRQKAERERLAEVERERLAEVERIRRLNAMKIQQREVAQARVLGWSLLGAGGLAFGLGGWLIVDGLDRGSDLKTRLDQKDPAGAIVGISREEALDAQRSANLRLGGGGGLLAVGVAAVGAGLYLIVGNEAAKVALLPGRFPKGASLSIRF